MKSFLATTALVLFVALVVKATGCDDADDVTVSPPIPALVAGPPGITDATLREAHARRTHVIYTKGPISGR
jgi:hypothetical protein